MTGDTHETDLNGLFEEYIALREESGSGDVDALMRRAGERAEGLRERIQVYGMLRELGELIADDGEPPEAPPPKQLGRFEILRPIGEGGLSRVFLGWDQVLEREAAIKVMRSSAHENGRGSWIVSEARKLARLEHESIVRVLDVGDYEGRAYVAMEYVPGPTLAEVLDALREPPSDAAPGSPEALALAAARRLHTVAERARFVLQIARALAYCHERGIVHRDIKPGNVLIDAAGTPRLIDFGLAKLDADDSLFVTDRLVGTPAYLAPEQVDNERTGASTASDQFSLGVLLYELLTLANPFARKGRSETLTAISRATLPAPRKTNRDVPVDLERICLHCLERSPEQRYVSISGLIHDLEAFLGHRAISLQAPSFARQTGLLIHRYKSQVRVAGTALVAVAVVLAAVTAMKERSKRSAVLAWTEDRRGDIDTYLDPAEFEATFEGIAEQRNLAKDYDAALFAGILWPRVTPELDDVWQRASKRLEDVLAPVFALADSKYGYVWQTQHYETANVLWKDSIGRLGLSNPGRDPLNPFLPIGFVNLPDGGTLERYEGMPGLPTLTVVDRERYLPGMYRYTSRIDGAPCQTEFWVSSLMPRKKVAIGPIDPQTEARLVAVDGTTFAFATSEQEPIDHSIAPFRISPQPVTWAEVRRVFGDELKGMPELGSLADSGPATLSWCEANEFARRINARLPTPPELWQALRTGVIAVPEAARGPEALFDREWVSTTVELDKRHPVTYADLEADPPRPSRWGAHVQFDTDAVAGVCFRVALSR